MQHVLPVSIRVLVGIAQEQIGILLTQEYGFMFQSVC